MCLFYQPVTMKYIFPLFMAISMFSACTKDKEEKQTNMFRVKAVAGMCADLVLQIQDPEYYHLGVNKCE